MIILNLRLSVFAMGVIAGLLQLRNVEDQNHDKTFLHDIFPWTFTQEQFSEISKESRERSWQSRVDKNFLFLVFIILFGILKTVVPAIPNLNLMTQFSCVHLQLILMLGLTMNGGRSWLSMICRFELVSDFYHRLKKLKVVQLNTLVNMFIEINKLKN